jgi:hypothetical protein
MRLSGTAMLDGPASQVWAALTDPAVLARTIPGCEQLEPAGPDSYRFTVTAGVASVRGTYSGEVELSQQQEPTSLVLTARCAGTPGTVATSIQITLTPGGGTTEVSYDADVAVGGLIAGVGQRMLASVGRLLIDEFLSSVDLVLAGNGAVSDRPAPVAIPGHPPVSAAPQPSASAALGSTGATSTGATKAPAFLGGALAGAAVTLAGVAIRGLIGRRSR